MPDRDISQEIEYNVHANLDRQIEILREALHQYLNIRHFPEAARQRCARHFGLSPAVDDAWMQVRLASGYWAYEEHERSEGKKKEAAYKEFIERAAQDAFNAYSRSRRGRTYDDKPIPKWEGLTEGIQEAWKEAAHAVWLISQEHHV